MDDLVAFCSDDSSPAVAQAAVASRRFTRSSTATAAQDERWLGFFAAARLRAVAYEGAVVELQATWRQRLGRARRRSATDLLLTALAGAPIITVQSAAALIDRSTQANDGHVTAPALATDHAPHTPATRLLSEAARSPAHHHVTIRVVVDPVEVDAGDAERHGVDLRVPARPGHLED